MDSEPLYVLAFRGTNGSEDVNADIAAIFGSESSQFAYTKNLAQEFLKNLEYKNLYVTGHSLGGYLAGVFIGISLKDFKNDNVKHATLFNAPRMAYGLFSGSYIKELTRWIEDIGVHDYNFIKPYQLSGDGVVFGGFRYQSHINLEGGSHSIDSYADDKYASILNNFTKY